jgi:hypothetical protein
MEKQPFPTLSAISDRSELIGSGIRSAGPINQPLLWKQAVHAGLEIEASTMTTVIFLNSAVPGVNGDTFPCAITTAEALASAILSESGRHQHWLGHGCTFEPEQPRSLDRVGPWAVNWGGKPGSRITAGSDSVVR